MASPPVAPNEKFANYVQTQTLQQDARGGGIGAANSTIQHQRKLSSNGGNKSSSRQLGRALGQGKSVGAAGPNQQSLVQLQMDGNNN